MKAIEITAPGDVRIVERPAPSCGPGDALLRVRRVGFCGTDLSTYRGANPLVDYPRIPGHEIGATIEHDAGRFTRGMAVDYAHSAITPPCVLQSAYQVLNSLYCAST